MRDPKRDVTEHFNPPPELDPTRELTTYKRDGNAADAARRGRVECAMLPPPTPTAAQLAHGWGAPLALVERLLKLEFLVENLQLFAERVNNTSNPAAWREIRELTKRIEALERRQQNVDDHSDQPDESRSAGR